MIARDNAVIRKDDPVPANRISDNHAKALRATAKLFDKDAHRQNSTEELQRKLPNATMRKSASEPPKAELRTDTPDRYSGLESQTDTPDENSGGLAASQQKKVTGTSGAMRPLSVAYLKPGAVGFNATCA